MTLYYIFKLLFFSESLNSICSNEYSPQTKAAMASIGSRDLPFELVDSLLEYIASLQIPGAVLVFLPGWSQIFALMKHLQMHPVFGSSKYRIIPLHSQLPREDQRAAFDHAPDGITKVILSTNIAETSITIDDIVHVVDVGTQKEQNYDPRTKVSYSYCSYYCAITSLML